MINLLHQDRDKNFLEKTRRYLEKYREFSICSFDSPEDALACLENRTFDVIVAGADGIELLKALNSRAIAIPFIFLSESMGEKMVIEALNLGADYFLLKGEESEKEFNQLKDIVGQYLTLPKVAEEIQSSNKIPNQDPEPVIRVSREGFLTDANPAAYPLLEKWGITIGQPVFDPVKETVSPALFNGSLVKTELAAGETSYLFTFKPENYETIPSASIHAITEKKKTKEFSDASTALKKEIAQRKLAEATTRKTLSLLNAALESTADGILVVDRAGRITSYNAKYVTMWDIPDSVMKSRKGNTVFEYIKNKLKDPEGYINRVNEISEHAELESFDMIELNDGTIFERYSKPQKIGNAVVGRVWSYRDVTDRKRAEEILLASLRDKEVMLREIHHRVKNNLQIVSGLLDMTRKRSQDPATIGILMDMMMKIDTMAQIHTRLYESKQFDKIDMNIQIRDQVSALTNIYSSKDCEISTTIKSSSIYLSVDQAIPCALLINEILTNAYKHAFKGRNHGTIEISAIQENGHITISIHDDGIGIRRDFDTARSNSLGFKLIRALIQFQLKGSFMINNDTGTEIVVKFPVQIAGM
jgi:PAS domain S-box-containing protein